MTNSFNIYCSDKCRQRVNDTDGRSSKLVRTYGITLDDYNRMFAAQKGCCIICERHQIEFKRKLAIDHDHVTGKVRGLLCQGCNQGLGFFKDNVQLMKKAILYIEEKS